MTTQKRVLDIFRKLHRTRRVVFAGDDKALVASCQKINEEFQKNKNVTTLCDIEELLKTAEDAEMLLRTHVVQAVRKDKDCYELKIRSDTKLDDNVPYDPHTPDPDPSTFTGECGQSKEFL